VRKEWDYDFEQNVSVQESILCSRTHVALHELFIECLPALRAMVYIKYEHQLGGGQHLRGVLSKTKCKPGAIVLVPFARHVYVTSPNTKNVPGLGVRLGAFENSDARVSGPNVHQQYAYVVRTECNFKEHVAPIVHGSATDPHSFANKDYEFINPFWLVKSSGDPAKANMVIQSIDREGITVAQMTNNANVEKDAELFYYLPVGESNKYPAPEVAGSTAKRARKS
jgi:hypothetical protein